jgi:hypothetical protein
MDNDDNTKAVAPLTQRQAIEDERHGGFNKALLKAADSGNPWNLMDAYAKADQYNQARLDRVFPDGLAICRKLYNDWPNPRQWTLALLELFPKLADLDGPVRYDGGQTVVEEIAPGVIELTRTAPAAGDDDLPCIMDMTHEDRSRELVRRGWTLKFNASGDPWSWVHPALPVQFTDLVGNWALTTISALVYDREARGE